jgi:hypothetical protein
LTKVSAAPSASARSVAAAPSPADDETINTLASRPAAIRSGSAVRPSTPGISISSRMNSVVARPRNSSAALTDPTAPTTEKHSLASTIRAITARATTESSTINTRAASVASRLSRPEMRRLSTIPLDQARPTI